jgi:hypothetical protein
MNNKRECWNCLEFVIFLNWLICYLVNLVGNFGAVFWGLSEEIIGLLLRI